MNTATISKFPPHKGYTVYSEHSLDEVLSLIPEAPDENIRFKLGEYDVKVGSPRLVNYKVNGVKCETCGRKGHVWRVESNGSHPHLNLYSEDGCMITKDHILPRSNGGSDTVDNYQPMCKSCNGKKGNKFNADEYLGRKVVWKAQLIWFMDAPYQGRIQGVREEGDVIKVWVKLDRGGYFGWCKLSDFSFMK